VANKTPAFRYQRKVKNKKFCPIYRTEQTTKEKDSVLSLATATRFFFELNAIITSKNEAVKVNLTFSILISNQPKPKPKKRIR
jgi:hypothetical protein